MQLKTSVITSTVAALLLAGCQQNAADKTTQPTPAPTEQASTEVVEQSESAKLNEFFETMFKDAVSRSPQFQTQLGIKDNNDKWNDISEDNALAELNISKQNLAQLETFDVSKLDPQTALSYQLAHDSISAQIEGYKWRHHNYPVDQMHGLQSRIPSFLINQHGITNVDDANDYISRIKGIRVLVTQLLEQLKIREDKGIVPPTFVFPHVIRDSQNLIQGAPFNGDSESILLADFNKKVNALEISAEQKQQLTAEATTALIDYVQPAYQDLIDFLIHQEARSTNDAGAWKFPEADAFYKHALARITTTDLSAEEIHQIGLSEVARIHEEMRVIKDKVGFKGDLNEFMVFMREDDQFYYPQTEAGKQQYLDEATAIIDTMKTRLDELFNVQPKAEMIVKRVEAFREKSAGKAFYNSPALDGSRPGIYYANLYDMKAMPVYQMEALAYHEGIPGHHMQLAISQELEGLPTFRKFLRFTAYIEGWGLYSEKVPKEIGFYQDPYSDFGRLAMELWRAVRLVVDTGMHDKKWTREQSIDFYVNNTPNAKSDAIKMVERHAVMPAQATAYKIGMLEILKLRSKAQDALGDKFDIRDFHDVYLKNGPLPLTIIGQKVDEYIASKK
ncbi:DUF885 domain-containing protein [Thalassotalea crassostreae]|uniref:DUF885 domain-containing protein n=1 Tax=Thalassotalea crassostreae TaxID=1763536 RepID=UPI000839A0D0|nr:DUF885 domain-containing protein [Thalassotalea crassostreae]